MEVPEHITRTTYLERVRPYIGKPVIKVLVGQRRVGKSYLLFQIMAYLTRTHRRPRLIYVNRELHEFAAIGTHTDLVNHVMREAGKARLAFVLVDEVQEIEGFEKALRSLLADGRFDVYCTGSNAKLLSGELATLLAGRAVQIRVHPLSYLEFLEFHKLQNTDAALKQYIRYGGLPSLPHIGLDEFITGDYLRNIYDAILFRDIVARHTIRNVPFLEQLVRYLAEHVGSLVSAKRVSDFLKSQRVSVSTNVVLAYIGYLCDAFFLNRARRYDIPGRRQFEIGDKFYFEDIGLRHGIIGYDQAHIGRILENLVYNHLRVCGYDVFVGKVADKEVDFVALRGERRLYVQFAYLIPDEATHAREYAPLLAIADNHPKIVVTMDPAAGGAHQGIPNMHIRQFLSQNW
ncbi:MAG: AAA family ATPase [Chitinivibrionales bacterium]|nr:AAA family ATPase [Chitinivibrionales bacterium]